MKMIQSVIKKNVSISNMSERNMMSWLLRGNIDQTLVYTRSHELCNKVD